MLQAHRVAWLSIGASVATLVLKFAAYFVTDSISLFSDAMESFVNLTAGLVALAVLTIVARPADESHPYGHDKAEYFSSGVEGGLIIIAAMSII
jgi:divalent metal cation (Fe/Co/Zn/Cd) transporter